jgi:hypothetical protein
MAASLSVPSVVRIAERTFPWLAALIALLFLWIGFDELQYDSARRPHQFQSVLYAFAISALFGITATACLLRWRIGRVAALVCAGCLVLFTISGLREGGWEDASGIFSIGLLVFAGIASALGLILGLLGRSQ